MRSLNRGRWNTIASKIAHRLTPDPRDRTGEAAMRWCADRVERHDQWARARDAALWDEAKHFATRLSVEGESRLASVPARFGGPSAVDFLYFITRLIRPQWVLETGVAAGWSSAAFLSAMEENQRGRLYSSDFPYIRRRGAAEHIGLLVDDRLRKRWSLFVDGDRTNIDRILSECTNFDIIHYDSDKTYSGRAFFFERIEPHLREGTIVIFDDIGDNFHFRDLVLNLGWAHHVFRFRNKYFGMIARKFPQAPATDKAPSMPALVSGICAYALVLV